MDRNTDITWNVTIGGELRCFVSDTDTTPVGISRLKQAVNKISGISEVIVARLCDTNGLAILIDLIEPLDRIYPDGDLPDAYQPVIDQLEQHFGVTFTPPLPALTAPPRS